MTEPTTPKPGTRLESLSEHTALARFCTTYGRGSITRPGDVPTWVNMVTVPTDETVFAMDEFAASTDVLVLFEYLNEVYRATPREVTDYLAHREPWEDYDMYVMPSDLRWVVAITHEQMHGIEIYVAGDVAGFRTTI